MQFLKLGNLFIVLIMVLVLAIGFSVFWENRDAFDAKVKATLQTQQNNALQAGQKEIESPAPLPAEKLKNPPEIIRAVYVTGHSAGAETYLNYLKNLFANTQINAVVIDIKGSDGRVSYASEAEDVQKYNISSDAIKDVRALTKFFHDQHIYVIGRISVFEDPHYSKARPELAVYDKEKTVDISKPVLWKDNNGLSWLDPASKQAWEYNLSLAKDAFYNGFDEINFDYIRFPSDGNTKNMAFPFYDGKTPKAQVITEFFRYLRENLPQEKISADLFGQTTVNTDDMGIGQIIENAFENFDYVSPMLYPSHYTNGFAGFENPAEHPYEVVKYCLDTAKNRQSALLQLKESLAKKEYEPAGSPAADLDAIKPPAFAPLAKIRPWLQDFNMGAFYTSDMVKQEIKAVQDSLGKDYNGFMLWNPSNIYTKEAVVEAD